MKSEYYWTFQIETSRFGGVMGASCDYVTEIADQEELSEYITLLREDGTKLLKLKMLIRFIMKTLKPVAGGNRVAARNIIIKAFKD